MINSAFTVKILQQLLPDGVVQCCCFFTTLAMSTSSQQKRTNRTQVANTRLESIVYGRFDLVYLKKSIPKTLTLWVESFKNTNLMSWILSKLTMKSPEWRYNKQCSSVFVVYFEQLIVTGNTWKTTPSITKHSSLMSFV